MPVVVSAQPLVEAIEAAIAAQGLAVGNGEKPAVADGRPYVVAWFDGGTVDDRSLRSRDGFFLTGVFQVYGFDPDSLQIATVKLRTAIFSLHLSTPGGRTVQMPEQLSSTTPDRDDRADPKLWWQVDEWRLRTTA